MSVDTSTMGSSSSTVSPTCLSHVVTVPSVTDSPRAGMVTEVAMCVLLLKNFRSVVDVERLACQRHSRFTKRLVLAGVCVDQGSDIRGVCLPVHHELALTNLFADARADAVEAHDRTALNRDQLDDARCGQDRRLSVAGEVVLDVRTWSPNFSRACFSVMPTEAISGSQNVTRGMLISACMVGFRPAISSATKMPA